MAQFQHQDIIEITHGASLLRFAPQAGGRLLSWHIDGEPVIYWPEAANWSQPAKIRGGNPLLFPFLGRHRVDGQIGRWRDATGTVRDLPMHGFARDLPFAADVEPAVAPADTPEATPAGASGGTRATPGPTVRMTLADSEATHDAYPFGFRFEAVYRLADDHTLDVELTTVNTGMAALPYYAGHHFYFSLPHTQRGETELELPPTEGRYQQADGSISAASPGAARYTLDEARILDCFHCLTDDPAAHSGSAAHAPVRLIAPGLNRSITFDLQRPGSVPWYAVTTWTEAAESDFYCIEPWLGLPDAIHNGLGLRWLEPGQTETAALRIAIGALR
jgi:galactose mutarotase-like enzyme